NSSVQTCYCFSVSLETGRSLKITDERSALSSSPSQTFLNYFCVRLDYFRYIGDPKITVRRHRAPTLIGC
ncbi:hypothetical protein, partial [Paraburkholderia sp. C35]|uniref:hypothetical protein n=1 Tax=Paraburkholderia sp. C35 TaxID=2126993 RepID=UPI00195226E4